MAGAHCRGRALADGSPDESESVRSLRPALPAVAAEKIPAHPLRQRLRADWKKILPPAQCSYVLGNPPFVGKHYKMASKSRTWKSFAANSKAAATLIMLRHGFSKRRNIFKELRIEVGFVATNSITQGEQVGFFGDAFSPLQTENSFCPSHFCVGKRSAWQSARSRCHHRLWRV